MMLTFTNPYSLLNLEIFRAPKQGPLSRSEAMEATNEKKYNHIEARE